MTPPTKDNDSMAKTNIDSDPEMLPVLMQILAALVFVTLVVLGSVVASMLGYLPR